MRIETERLVIRNYELKDANDLCEYMIQRVNAQFERYADFTPEKIPHEIEYRAGSDEFYAIELKENHKVIGNVYMGNRDFCARELGYVLNENYQHKGYGSEAAYATVIYFLNNGTRRIFAECNPDNIASWKTMEKIGMTREASFRKNVSFRNDENGNPIYWDTYVYAILESDLAKNQITSYCGLDCNECDYRETINCTGCIANKGIMPWGKCDVAECIKEKGGRFCGECPKFPCDTLTKYSYDKEHGDDGARIERAKKQKLALVKEARAGLPALSVCGFNCDYCFMSQWCGGCRSDYNCCSFATVCEGGVCDNVTCAKEKNLSGCFECDELENCKKGFYNTPEGYGAVASAMFIKKYGKERCEKATKKAIQSGKQLNELLGDAKNAQEALKILEQLLG